MNYKNFVGIDYSISSPGITILKDTNILTPHNCNHYFFNGLKKLTYANIVSNVHEFKYPEYTTQISKFSALSSKVMEFLKELDPKETLVAIEGYATGARGKVFHIGENTGILKAKLHEAGFSIVPEELTSPKTIKKFTTGSGNAKKGDMYQSYLKDGGNDIKLMLQPKKDIEKSFVADIIDSYYLCKFATQYTK
jgi:hypothetical protein